MKCRLYGCKGCIAGAACPLENCCQCGAATTCPTCDATAENGIFCNCTKASRAALCPIKRDCNCADKPQTDAASQFVAGTHGTYELEPWTGDAAVNQAEAVARAVVSSIMAGLGALSADYRACVRHKLLNELLKETTS